MPILRVLHLTDIHLDMMYTPGLETKCSEPQCCRPQKNSTIFAKTDIKQPAGYWGMVGDCDAPYWLLTNMLEFIQKNHKDVSFTSVHTSLKRS
ncbi:unnamed protein product [Angiostrongylus costaricensis]|uniref:Metallophos domain-containing protein n=1 Tax=Angiostrongylus costaricensis TaxID=334426 RepID=A0A0R3PBW0_ANGCS|nr:unnamed protein product [Angiostrongylus costaricensis]